MIHNIKRKVLVLILVDITFFILAMSVNMVNILTILTVGQLILELVIIREKSGRFFCLSNIFIILSYILHMGNLVFVCLLQYKNDYIVSLDKSTLINSILFFMLCHLFFVLGTVFVGRRSIKINMKKKHNISFKVLEQVGWISLFIGIIPRIYIDCKQISMQLNGDYLNALNNINKYGIVGILALFFYVGAAIVMYTSVNHRIRARIILVLITIWEMITMLSGGRIYAMSLIIVLFYLYCLKIEQPKMKTVVLGGIAGGVISIIMAVISRVRIVGSFNTSDIQNMLSGDFLNQNPIISFLVEMGGTMKSLAYSIQDFPSYSNYALGKTYLETIISVIPFIGEKIVDIKNLVYIYNFRSFMYLGGSWLGEVYFNFSWLGCIICFFIGRWIFRIDKTLEDNNENNNIVTMFCLAFLFYIIRYTRDYFYGFAQPIQVCVVLLMMSIIVNLFNKHLKKKS